ncbi:MAG: two pore domain potassium channel family protein [Acidimicrobiales bacterium]|nr:two pore domain potassium channel family protein [Acidimicrobiales bacterium]RZV43839.1 MAG: two pore domain potassium channel family protein [Acidimicrobiales bacterium]
MEDVLWVAIGVVLVASVLADMINTLVTTTNSSWNWWLTRILYRRTWSLTQTVGRVIKNETKRERFYSVFAPLSILLMLASWVAQQIVGFALIWWGLGDLSGADGFVDSLYYSGVVFFTVGFGEVVPIEDVGRFGALIEAFFGVLTVALVIGYIPALYSAYSAREQKLLTLDDGTEERITPTNLVLSQCPNADPERLEDFFKEWEAWVAHVLETHVTFPMLSLFRSQHPGQSWITALGLVTDAALHMELIEGQQAKSAYWLIRRSARLLHALTEGADISEYRAQLDEGYESSNEELFRELYDTLEGHGFTMIPFEEAVVHSQELRRTYDAHLEFLIDRLEAPRGFWGHEVGHKLRSFANEGAPEERWRG